MHIKIVVLHLIILFQRYKANASLLLSKYAVIVAAYCCSNVGKAQKAAEVQTAVKMYTFYPI